MEKLTTNLKPQNINQKYNFIPSAGVADEVAYTNNKSSALDIENMSNG